MEKIKVAVYMRVNTIEKARELDEQLYALTRYADLMDLEIVRIYKDLSYSGIDNDRPGLQALKADVYAGEIDTILVYSLDRLTRSTNDLLRLFDLFDDNGTNLLSARDNFDTSNAIGRFSVGILRSFKEAVE